MPATPAPGMDHALYGWSPLPARPALRWPAGKPLAFSLLLLVEHMEVNPPEGSVQAPLPGGFGPMFPRPNLPALGHREYGHRIGIFRILDVLNAHGIRPSVAIDAMAAERYPAVVDACREAGAEFVGHGLSASRIVSSSMSETDERAYIAESLARIRAATGAPVTGWIGTEQSESERTPRLLDAAGLDYVCDWPNDEQPYYLDTPGKLVSVATTWGLDDSHSVWARATSPHYFGDALVRSADRLAQDGTASGRSLIPIVRPWLMGQPFRIGALDKALGAIAARDDIWAATTGEIAAAFRQAMR